MTDNDRIKVLDQELRTAKRVASEWAMQLHDLVEDGLPREYRQLLPLAESTFQACKAWDEARQRLDLARQP